MQNKATRSTLPQIKEQDKRLFFRELLENKVDLITCRPSKRPTKDWTPATLKECLAHEDLFAILHPSGGIGCIDIDQGLPWSITQMLEDLDVDYVLEGTPRGGWHIWFFCRHPIGIRHFEYGDIRGEIRTSDGYTILYDHHIIAELLDSNRREAPMSLLHHLLDSAQALIAPTPAAARPRRQGSGKRKRSRKRRRSGPQSNHNHSHRGGRNNQLSSGLYSALKSGQPTARHTRLALMRGLPADEVEYTLAKKKRQRNRDIARREQTLQENVRQHPLPKTRSDCKLTDVLRVYVDFGLDSGFACPKRETVAQIAKCCVTTVSRHTKTLQENGNITQAGVVVAAIHPTSGWEYRVNLWAITVHTLKCHTKALRVFPGWVVRVSERLPAVLASVFSPLLSPRASPTTSTLSAVATTDVDVTASRQLAFFDVVARP